MTRLLLGRDAASLRSLLRMDWQAVFMDHLTAQRSAHRVGMITLPLGLVLLCAPARAGRFLHLGEHQVALRVIGALDLALVPGLLLDGGRWQWLTARAGLNVGIASYCLKLALRDHSPAPMAGVAAMLAATIADTQAIKSLYRFHQGAAVQVSPI